MKHVTLSLTLASLLLAFAASAQPPGETCETALPLIVPGIVEGSNCGFADNYDEMCPYGGTGPDVAYVYTPVEDQLLNVDMCLGTTNYDTKLIVFSEVCNNNHTVACNDDYCTAPNYPYPYVSRLVNVPLSAGITYYLIVDGYGSECGNYTLQATIVPPGDLCENALPLSVPDTVSGNTCAFTDQYDHPCPYQVVVLAPDVVYAYTPTVNQRVDFTLCGGTTNYDTKMFLYAGTCINPPYGCNDDACAAPETPFYPSEYVSRLYGMWLTAGTTYYVVIDAYDTGLCGDYTLVTSLVPPNPPQHLVILREPDNSAHLRLTWNPSFGANIYYIYRDAADPMHTLLATTPDTFYVDNSAVNDPATHYFYLVTAGLE